MSVHRILESIEKSQRRQASLPEFRPGDSVKVWAKIREGEKTRLQAFEGVCIRRVSKGTRSTFTVRKISYGVGVERIFPDNSPNIDKVEVLSRGRVHQSRLQVGHEALKARSNVPLRHVDVIALSDTRGTVPHESGKREFIHAALGAARSERVTPAVELERLQASIPCCFLVRMLNGHEVA